METGFALSEGQISAQKRPRRVLKLVPKANQAENEETIKIIDSTTDFLDAGKRCGAVRPVRQNGEGSGERGAGEQPREVGGFMI